MNREEEFTFVITEHLGVLAVHTTGWKKEVNIVEWNGNGGKVDIRDWNPSHEKMGKGITLHKEEARKLMNAISSYLEKDDKGENDKNQNQEG